MWNWLVSALAVGASVVLYDGSPFVPSPNVIWDLVDKIGWDEWQWNLVNCRAQPCIHCRHHVLNHYFLLTTTWLQFPKWLCWWGGIATTYLIWVESWASQNFQRKTVLFEMTYEWSELVKSIFISYSLITHQSAKSEGLRFNFTWGFRIFSLFHTCDKTKKKKWIQDPLTWNESSLLQLPQFL